MATEIILPKLGQTMEFATVVRWLVAEGDRVEKGQPILEIETDKAVLEVESLAAGTLLKILAQPAETYDVLDVLGYVGEPGEAVPEAAAKTAAEKKARKREEAPPKALPAKAPRVRPAAVAREEAPETAVSVRGVSPRARKLTEQWLLDPADIVGSGPGGRVVERDVQAYLDQRKLGPSTMTEAARVRAREAGLKLDELVRLAHGEKVTVEVVEQALRTRPTPLSAMRRAIAERMSESARTIPHFYVTMSADMEAVARFRDAHAGPDGAKISYNDFVVAACAAALREMPIVNARCVGDGRGEGLGVQMNEEVNVGIAVSVDDGLVVPVIRGADKRPLEKIAAESKRLVERARSRSLRPEEMAGGTFTITNMGMLGVESFGAIIHPEQGAILAVGAVEEMPVAREGEVKVRKRMRMTLSCDHRIIDGAVGAQFLGLVKERLEAFAG
jgi:pyruvate dehydrogenase E2 component (dihydrolipoamide acetyltransferase)